MKEGNLPFQIPAEAINDFHKQGFQNIIRYNDSLTLEYYFAPGLIFIGQDRNVLISIDARPYSFLRKDKSVQTMSDESIFALVVGAVSLIAGVILKRSVAGTSPNTANNNG